MKKLIIIAVTISLVASAAFAAAPEGAFKSASKVMPMKSSAHDGVNLGLLDCTNAIEIVLGATYDGDNTGAVNNVTTYGCSPWDESGGEVVYYLNLTTPSTLTIDLIPDGCDLDLAVLSECDEDLGCILVADFGVFADEPISGEFYFVVDGYLGAGCPFQLVTTDGSPPEVNFCDVVDQANGGDTFSGTTCGGLNLISALGCEDFTENGLEYYYEVFMPAGSSFTADVTSTADGALWVVDACEAPFGCLAYADDTLTGELETVSYTNDSASDMFVYLVLDSWGTDTCGDYDMTFATTGGAVAVEGAAFGAVKALYR